MKKYMVRCDIEGFPEWSAMSSRTRQTRVWVWPEMFMSDLLALIEGLNQGGADEIIVYDEHYYGRNIDMDALPENVTAICGKPPYKADWAGGWMHRLPA
jgi:D-amino peptidase